MFKPTPKVLACAVAAALSSQAVIADELDNSTAATGAEELETIVVSGTRTKKALKDVAGSISVLTQEELDKQVVTDMSQLFKYDPSVQVTGSVGQAQNFVVRGMGGDRVLMIKDGMRMNEGYGADGLNDIVGRGFIDTDTLKQVEVAKGAASSLYGSDALGGIIVFTTKDAADYLSDGETFAGKVKFGYSDASRQYSLGTTLALVTGDFDHLLSLTTRDGEEQQNFSETKPALDIESTSILYKGKYKINDTDFVALTADIYNQDVTGDYANGLLEYFRNLTGYNVVTENSTSEQENESFQLRYYTETPTAIYDVLNVSVYSNETEQTDVEYGQLDINANFGFPLIEIRDMWKTSVYTQETVGLLSNASLKLNDTHTIGYGLDIENSESTRTEVRLYEVEGVAKPGYPQESDKFPKTEVNRAGFFINDEITLADGKLTVTPGARFDTYEMDPNGATQEDGTEYKKFDESNVSLNLGALYRIDDSVSVFAQYGQGFKVPAYDLAYIYHDNSLYGYIVEPSGDLSPEESDTYELGLRGSVGDFFFSSAAFYSKYDDFLSTEYVRTESVVNPYTGQASDVYVYHYTNIDAVTIKGIEASVTYHLNNEISVFANAAYQDGTDDETGDYITSISPLSGIAGISYSGEKLSTELILNWSKRMTKVNEGDAEVAGYGKVDWLVNYDVTEDVRFNLSVNNLFDKEYVQYANVAGHASSDSQEYAASPGRSFSANVSVSF